VTDLFGGSPEPTLQPDPDRDVQFLDTTLRDGEQAPGVSLTPEEKAAIARELDSAGVAVVEAGSACTGAGEREAISRVTDLGLDATVTSFCRGLRGDIEQALDCGVDGVNLVVPASDRHVRRKVGTTRDAVVADTRELVAYARDHGLWVEVIGEDGSRADPEFLERLLGAALEAGATRVCYADTVGDATPDRVRAAVRRLAPLGPVGVHTHDDMGLAVTNALAGVAAGADLVHATVNGIGERAGNAALEELAVALAEGYGLETLELERLYGLARTVADATGVGLAPNKAVVGENAFAHESGIHTDGTLKDEAMYEPYPPERVGRERRLVLGKHTGRAGLRATLAEHGVEPDEATLDAALERVKALAERDRRVTDADLLAVVEDVRGADRERLVELEDLTATSGGQTPTASVRLTVDGEPRTAAGTGCGPVDAAMTAVADALGEPAVSLESYHVDAITGGTDAVVAVEVEMSRGDRTVSASAGGPDITRASVVAMVDALDRLLGDTADPAGSATD
jgi:D-citramalate synthase